MHLPCACPTPQQSRPSHRYTRRCAQDTADSPASRGQGQPGAAKIPGQTTRHITSRHRDPHRARLAPEASTSCRRLGRCHPRPAENKIGRASSAAQGTCRKPRRSAGALYFRRMLRSYRLPIPSSAPIAASATPGSGSASAARRPSISSGRPI